MIALPASVQRPASALATISSSKCAKRAASSGSPITPVEARNTSEVVQPTAFAAVCAVSAVDCLPVLPVKALALPEFTTSARACPRPSLARHHSTGADGHFDLVKTPATVVPLSMTASSTSVLPL